MISVHRWLLRICVLFLGVGVVSSGLFATRAVAQVDTICTSGNMFVANLPAQGNLLGGQCAQQAYHAFSTTADTARWVIVDRHKWAVKYLSCGASGVVFGCSVSPTKDSAGISPDTVIATVVYSTGATGASGQLSLIVSDDSGQLVQGVLTDSSPFAAVASFTNGTDQAMARCTASCFAATASIGTPPYFSLGQPRSISLNYHGDRVRARPFVYSDVSTFGSIVPTTFRMQVTTSAGAKIRFTNGDSILNFSGGGGTYRLSGQLVLDSTIATGPLAVTVTTSAIYSTTTITQSTNLILAVVNERNSLVAHGWALANVQRLYPQAATSSVLIAEGTGSAEVFTLCSTTGCESPSGEYSTLYLAGSLPSTQYTRKYPDSSQVVFNSAGQEIKQIDAFGNSDSLAYDAQGRLIAVYDPIRTVGGSGRAYIQLAYGSTYGLASITSPGPTGSFTGGRTTSFTVSSSDSTLTAAYDPDGDSSKFGYDAHKRLAWERDRRGDTTKFGYDTVSWKMTSVTSPPVPVDSGNGMNKAALHSLTTTYAPWQTIGVPLAPTGTTPATPAGTSMIGTVTDPAGLVTTIQVNKWGQATTTTNALGEGMTVLLSDSNPIPQTITSPSGGTSSYTFSGSHILSAQPASGSAVNMLYNSGYGVADSVYGGGAPSQRRFIGTGGRIDSVRVDQHSSLDTLRMLRYTYDSRGRVLTASDIGGHTTHYHYDAVFGNRDSVQQVGNRVTVLRFDSFGRDSLSWNNSQPHVTTLYDVMNRVTSVNDGVNASPTTFAYDALFPVRMQDPKGQVFKTASDALGRTTAAYDAGDTAIYTSYRYSVSGLLTGVTDRRGRLMTMTYDSALRQLSMQRSVTGTVVAADSNKYTVGGGSQTVMWNNVERDSIFWAPSGWTDSVVTHFAAIPERFRIWYQPDSALRLSALSVAASGGGLSGNPTFTTRSYTYDSYTGRLTALELNGETKEQTHFTYNAEFNLVSTQYPGTGTSPLPGPLAQSLISLHEPYQMQFSSSSVLDNAMNQKFGYDSLGRVNTSVPVNTALNEWQITQYDYDGLGRLVAKRLTDSAGLCAADTTYGYQCGQEARQDTLEYDAVGNLIGGTMAGLTVSAGYRTGNRDTTLRGVTHTFDSTGNVTSNGSRSFYWGVEGHLDSVVAGTVTLAYTYNAAGQLATKSRNGTLERLFLWDGNQLLAEIDSAGSGLVGEYVSAGTDAPFAYIAWTNALLGNTSIISYHVSDALGNVVGLIRSDSGPVQAVREKYAYDEYGGQTLAVDSGYANRMTWKGMLYEGDSTRLYYARARWYDPEQGRFMSEDPAGTSGGNNQYVFGGGDHINMSDPTGMMECSGVTGPDLVVNSDGEPVKCNVTSPDTSAMALVDCSSVNAIANAECVGVEVSAPSPSADAASGLGPSGCGFPGGVLVCTDIGFANLVLGQQYQQTQWQWPTDCGISCAGTLNGPNGIQWSPDLVTPFSPACLPTTKALYKALTKMGGVAAAGAPWAMISPLLDMVDAANNVPLVCQTNRGVGGY